MPRAQNVPNDANLTLTDKVLINDPAGTRQATVQQIVDLIERTDSSVLDDYLVLKNNDEDVAAPIYANGLESYSFSPRTSTEEADNIFMTDDSTISLGANVSSSILVKPGVAVGGFLTLQNSSGDRVFRKITATDPALRTITIVTTDEWEDFNNEILGNTAFFIFTSSVEVLSDLKISGDILDANDNLVHSLTFGSSSGDVATWAEGNSPDLIPIAKINPIFQNDVFIQNTANFSNVQTSLNELAFRGRIIGDTNYHSFASVEGIASSPSNGDGALNLNVNEGSNLVSYVMISGEFETIQLVKDVEFTGDNVIIDSRLHINEETIFDNEIAAAVGTEIGLHRFTARNNAAIPDTIEFGQFVFRTEDINDGSENGGFGLSVLANGTLKEVITVDGTGSSPVIYLQPDGDTDDENTLFLTTVATTITSNSSSDPGTLRLTNGDSTPNDGETIGMISAISGSLVDPGIGDITFVIDDVTTNEEYGSISVATVQDGVEDTVNFVFGRDGVNETFLPFVSPSARFTGLVDIEGDIQLTHTNTIPRFLMHNSRFTSGDDSFEVGEIIGEIYAYASVDNQSSVDIRALSFTANQDVNEGIDGEQTSRADVTIHNDLIAESDILIGGTEDKNRLPIYEEDTWACANNTDLGPEIVTDLTDLTQHSFRYQRVGSWVTVHGRINFGTETATQSLFLTGLPYSLDNDGLGAFAYVGTAWSNDDPDLEMVVRTSTGTSFTFANISANSTGIQPVTLADKHVSFSLRYRTAQ